MLIFYRAPAGVVHIAFPAPSKDAVNSFFIAALKAGGSMHAEPKTRDQRSMYHNATVVDFDGNSIEAVYRNDLTPAAASEASGPSIRQDTRSVVSKSKTSPKAESVKAESVAPARTVVTKTIPKPDEDGKAAKTIVGTLIGAAAGAAIAYAMVKTRDDSVKQFENAFEVESAPEDPPPSYAPEQQRLMAAPSQYSRAESQVQMQPMMRAIEAPPTRSVYSAVPRSTVSRSMASKNPRASTIYDGTEFYDGPRRASDGSVISIPEDLPLRAIEYPPSISGSRYKQPCSPSTFISSYSPDKPRAGSVYSASTIKASQQPSTFSRRFSADDRDTYSVHSNSQHTAIYRPASEVQGSTSGSKKAPSERAPSERAPSERAPSVKAPSVLSEARSARNIPLPQGSSKSVYSAPPSDSGKSYVSAREIPLPKSVIDLDVDSIVTPDDSISQIGSRSGRSSHSRHSKSSKHSSRSKYDGEGSQVSRSSQRTVKASGSKAGSKAPSRLGSQLV